MCSSPDELFLTFFYLTKPKTNGFPQISLIRVKYLVYDYEMYQKIHLAKKKAEGPFGSSHLTN